MIKWQADCNDKTNCYTLQCCTVCAVSGKTSETVQPTLNVEKSAFLITLPSTDVIKSARAFWWNSASDMDCFLFRFVWPWRSSHCIASHSSVSLFLSLATVRRRLKFNYYDIQRKIVHKGTKVKKAWSKKWQRWVSQNVKYRLMFVWPCIVNIMWDKDQLDATKCWIHKGNRCIDLLFL
jgi:hypothetical protein